MKYLLLSLCLLFLSNGILSAQVSPAPAERCGTNRKLEEMLRLNPHLIQVQEAMLAGNPAGRPAGGPRTIPVVVHVIQASPSITISDDRIREQIQVLNEDYRRTNADTSNTRAEFKGVAADVNVEFCLATIDPNGCPTTGINRIVNATAAYHDSDNDEALLKGLVQWDPYKYLNVWVPERITTSVLGYATLPGWIVFDPGSDGVVISGEYFGRGFGTPSTDYNLGRTATHEVGHWLGLFHTFDGACAGSGSNCASAGDRCCDTPQSAVENYGCPGVKNSCTETPTDMNDQTENYMDYVNDACMNIFTQDQSDRMNGFLNTTRNVLVSGANLTATGCDGTPAGVCGPFSEFSADHQYICTGQTVTFTDKSQGPPDTWFWEFSGGTPSTSSDPNPVVVYSTPGVYSVKLTVTNILGSNIKNKTGYITVTDAYWPDIAESFESIFSLPTDWYKVNEDGGGSWELSTAAASNGSRSFVMKNFEYNSAGTDDALVTYPMNMKSAVSGQLTFDYAYKRYNAFKLDTFSIHVSTDCGMTWDQAWVKAGVALATVSGFAASAGWTPASAADWRKGDSLDLTPYLGSEAVRIKFVNTGRNGQNLWLDNINLNAVVGIEDGEISPLWSVSPNPFTEEIVAEIQLETVAEVSIELYDAAGKKVAATGAEKLQPGKQSIRMEGLRELSAGMYVIQVKAGSSQLTKKVIKTGH